MNTEKKIVLGVLTILLVTLGVAVAFAYNARAIIPGNNGYNNLASNGYNNQFGSNGYGYEDCRGYRNYECAGTGDNE